MATQSNYSWRRDKDGLGVWEHRGKVAVAGYGHSPVDRRWDGTSMDQTLGAYSILACQKAMDDAGVTPDQIDGIICCQSHIAGGSGGSASQWAPRPYFDPPYDSEWGLTLMNAEWLIKQMHLPNVKYAPANVPTISEMVGLASQAVETVCAPPVWSSTRRAIWKGGIVAAERTPTTMPEELANGRYPGGITGGTISLTSSRTISIASNTAAHTMTWPPL